MSVATQRKREKIHTKIHQIALLLQPDKTAEFEPILREIFDEIYDDVETLDQEKVPQSDIKLLILEMKEGFRQMEIRFEGVDKRFEAMDKRFEAVDKRFEDFNKRFEAMDKRFTSIQWFLGLGFTILAFIMAFFKYFTPY